MKKPKIIEVSLTEIRLDDAERRLDVMEEAIVKITYAINTGKKIKLINSEEDE